MTISIEELLLRVSSESPFLLTGVNGALVLVCRLEGRKEHVQLPPEDADRLLQFAMKWIKFDQQAKIGERNLQELIDKLERKSDPVVRPLGDMEAEVLAAIAEDPDPVDPDLETSAPRSYLIMNPEPEVPRLFTKDDEAGVRRFFLRNVDGTIQQLPLAPSPTVESVLTEAARLGIRSPYTAVQKRLTEDELQQALMNVGCDLRCGTCAEIFYTGSADACVHTCALKGQPSVFVEPPGDHDALHETRCARAVLRYFTSGVFNPPISAARDLAFIALRRAGVDLESVYVPPIDSKDIYRDPPAEPQDRAEEEAVLAEDRTEQARLEELALQEEAEDEARRQSRSWDSDP